MVISRIFLKFSFLTLITVFFASCKDYDLTNEVKPDVGHSYSKDLPSDAVQLIERVNKKDYSAIKLKIPNQGSIEEKAILLTQELNSHKGDNIGISLSLTPQETTSGNKEVDNRGARDGIADYVEEGPPRKYTYNFTGTSGIFWGSVDVQLTVDWQGKVIGAEATSEVSMNILGTFVGNYNQQQSYANIYDLGGGVYVITFETKGVYSPPGFEAGYGISNKWRFDGYIQVSRTQESFPGGAGGPRVTGQGDMRPWEN